MIPWAKIIEILVELIGGCLGANASEEDVIERFRNPWIGDRFRAERALRIELDLSWRDWQRQRSTLREQMEVQRVKALEHNADTIRAAFVTALEAKTFTGSE